MAAAGGIPIKEMANTAMKPCIRFMSGCQHMPLDKLLLILYFIQQIKEIMAQGRKQHGHRDIRN
jgi:hypothetical protein